MPPALSYSVIGRRLILLRGVRLYFLFELFL
jgi:hypothetical protein